MSVRPQSQRPRGRHYLRSRALAEQLVRDAAVPAGSVVLDLGAGRGILTRALADAGASVVAVELDPAAIAELRRRFDDDPRVTVVQKDATRFRLPDRQFGVVANVPFSAGTAILRTLLDDPSVPLAFADLIVEWGLAQKRAAVWPSTLAGAYWGAWHRLSIVRRVPRGCFAPPPQVDAAVLRVRRRTAPLVPVGEAPEYRAFLERAFGDVPVAAVVPEARRLAQALGFDRRARGRDLDAAQWAALFRRTS